MTDSVRCPSCRGAKKVAKLGGIVGECNTCVGKGTILASDKLKPVVAEAIEPIAEVIKAVAESVPVAALEADVKIDGKKVLYKRKTVR